MVRPLSSNVHGEEIHTGWEHREGGFLRGKDTFLDTLALPSPGFDLLLLSFASFSLFTRRIRERKCFYSKGRKDLRVNPLTRETAFHSELFPMEILSPLSAFVQSWIDTFYIMFSNMKRNQFLSSVYRLNRSKVLLSIL